MSATGEARALERAERTRSLGDAAAMDMAASAPRPPSATPVMRTDRMVSCLCHCMAENGIPLLPAMKEDNLWATSMPSVLKPKPFGFFRMAFAAASSNALSDAVGSMFLLEVCLRSC